MSLESGLGKAIIRSGFQESITYIPNGEPEITIDAVIEREDPNPKPSVDRNENGWFPLNGVRITIRNDAIEGVITVKKRFDKVKLPVRFGQAVSTLVITTILYHDAGIWCLEAEK